MEKFTKWLLPVVLSLALVGLVWQGIAVQSAKSDQQLARAATAQALKDATQAAKVATSFKIQADIMQHERDEALVSASEHKAAAARQQTKLATLVLTAPDTCKTIIITADSALAEKDSVIAADSVALSRSIASEASLKAAVDTLLPALTKLHTSATALVKADSKLAWRQLALRLLPRPGVGVAAGVDALGKPHVVYAVTLGWHL